MEDKVLFENSFEITEKIYIDFCNKPIGQSASRRRVKFSLLYSVFALVLLACTVYLAITANYFIAVISALLFAAYIHRLVWGRNFVNRRYFRRILRESGSEKWVRKTSFYSDRLVVSEFITDTTLKYNELYNITQDESFYYFWKNKDLVVRMAKSGFSPETAGEFDIFIKDAIHNIDK